jgi:hypothetical protein
LANTELPDDSFIREVDEEYRRDQMKSLWVRYGRWILSAIGIGLVALAGFLYWSDSQSRHAGEAGEQFTQALAKIETGDVAGATPALQALAKSGDSGYGALAVLMQAADAVQAGDTDAAIKLYASIQDDAKLPAPFRQLALIRATQLEFDTLPPAKIIERLKPLAVPGDAWFGIAGEMTAIAYLRDNKPALAAPLLSAIAADATLPPLTRSRATQLGAALAATPAPPAAATAIPAAPTAPPAAATPAK